MLTSKYYDDHDKPRTLYLHTDGHYVDSSGHRYDVVPAPEPVDIAALRDAAIDALLRADAHRGTPYEPGADDLCRAYESAAREWASAAGHRDA